MILWVRDIYDVFKTNEKSMITNYFTMCKAKVELNIISKPQDNKYYIEEEKIS